jgi:hypothetical protein
VGTLICLLSFTESVDAAAGSAIPTVPQYIERVLFQNESPADELIVNTGLDTGLFKTVAGGVLYDLLYREKKTTSEGVEKDVYAGGYTYHMSAKAGFKHYGLLGSLNVRKMQGVWSGESYRLHGNGEIAAKRLSFGGWWKYNTTSFMMKITSDLGHLADGEDEAFSLRHPTLLLKTPVLDLYTAARLELPLLYVTMSFENRTLLTGEAFISNKSNSAYRKIPLYIDENRVGMAAAFSRPSLRLDVTAIMGWFGENHFSEKPFVLPMSVQGKRMKVDVTCQAPSLFMQPEAYCSIHQARLLLEGRDEAGGRFLNINNGRYFGFDGGIFANTDRRSKAGIVVSAIDLYGGNGMIGLYPFTNWLLLLDLPDRYKFYYESLTVVEVGISGTRTFPISGKQRINIYFALTGCTAESAVRVADLVLYMHVLPNYENDRMEQIAKKYAIVKGCIDYSFDIGHSVTTLCLQQMLPIELVNRIKPSSTTNDPSRSESTRSVFGGTSVSATVTLYW